VSLSFREQAAIAVWTDPARNLDEDAAARAAQKFADECCKQWGHVREVFQHPTAGNLTALYCERCGAPATAITKECK